MRDYVLTGLIFGLLPVYVMRPWVGVIVWYWFGIMNPHRLTWTFAYDMPFAVWIGGATLLGTLFAKDRKPIPWNAVLVIVAILFLYYTFTSFFAWAPDYAWAQWRKFGKIVLMTFVATMFIYGRQRIYALMMTIVLSIGFYGVKGVLFVISTGGAGHIQGPEGSFIEGNTFLGLAFLMVIPLAIYLARNEERRWLRNSLFAIAFAMGISTIFTYSRGAYVGLVAILPLIFLRSKRRWLMAVVGPVVIGIGLLMVPESVYKRAEQIEGYQEESSANQRLQAWTVNWNIAKEQPLTGAGFEFEYGVSNEKWLSYGSDKYAWALKKVSAAHSIYFQVLGQHGFIAFAIWILLLVVTLVSLRRLRIRAQSRPNIGWIANYATSLQIGMVAYLVGGAFLSLAYFDLVYLYFAFVAILWREVHLAEQSVKVSAHPVDLPGKAAGAALQARS